MMLATVATSVSAKSKPNIIIILSDDMGYSDVGCYGGEIRTPNLDRLAKQGVRFTQFYNTARCCPTRASLLTGLYPHQAGLGGMTTKNKNDRRKEFEHHPGYIGELSENCVTIAQVLKTAGYTNYAVGKWHVAANIDPEGAKYNWPLQRGFDKYYGTIRGANSYWDPGTLVRNNTMISAFNDPEYHSDHYYYTDALSDNAVNYIKQNDSSKPFFMYLAYTAAHWPMHAPEKEIEKYKGVYDNGWDYIREKRYEKLKELGLIDKNWSMSPSENKGWEKEENKPWMVRRMETYAAMVDVMDQGIGRIIRTLKEKGEFENTLIFFLQDNGACAEENGSSGEIIPANWESMPLHPMKKEEIQTEMIPVYTRDGRPVLQGYGVMPGPENTHVAYGQEWANVSNTPFRLYKKWNHEGGIATPLIVCWPNQIKGNNELRDQPGHLIDLMATCVAVSGANYPEKWDGKSIIPMEGKSLVPAFANKDIDRDYLIFEHMGNRAIRVGDWKLVHQEMKVKGAKVNPLATADEWELYNMKSDRTELHNLAYQYPDKVKQMIDLWYKEAKRTFMYDENLNLKDINNAGSKE